MAKMTQSVGTEWERYVGGSGTRANHPAGAVSLEVLDDIAMSDAQGGASGWYYTLGCCWCLPWYSSWTRCGLLCHSAGSKLCK